MWKQVAPLFVVAVLVGWFMPVGHAPNVPGDGQLAADVAKPAPKSAAVAARKPNLLNMPDDGVVLDRSPNNHFYADAIANGQGVRFMVDTGATVVALTAKDAERIGLFWTYNELENVGRGVSGDVQGKRVVINSLQLGGLSASNVQAVIIPDGLDISLLGQSFLSGVGSVSISGNKMTLKN
jgi:aspartyl protease family protein